MGLFFEFKKAFDSVQHILFKQLDHYGICSVVLNSYQEFPSMLLVTKQCSSVLYPWTFIIYNVASHSKQSRDGNICRRRKYIFYGALLHK